MPANAAAKRSFRRMAAFKLHPGDRIEAVCDEDGCVFDILRQG
jgi:hypothetical protein